jgi:hypothetical protein
MLIEEEEAAKDAKEGGEEEGCFFWIYQNITKFTKFAKITKIIFLKLTDPIP